MNLLGTRTLVLPASQAKKLQKEILSETDRWSLYGGPIYRISGGRLPLNSETLSLMFSMVPDGDLPHHLLIRDLNEESIDYKSEFVANDEKVIICRFGDHANILTLNAYMHLEERYDLRSLSSYVHNDEPDNIVLRVINRIFS